jgi:hypothetical protein
MLSLVEVQAQQGVTFQVVDAETAEPLEGAEITLPDQQTGAWTDPQGQAVLEVLHWPTRVVVRWDGYQTHSDTLRSPSARITVSLKPLVTTTETVVVRSGTEQTTGLQSHGSLTRIDAAAIKTMPVLLGEADILKTLQLLPGIQTNGEGSSGFSVRGGSTDQNLVLLDGAPLYNPTHLMGFFSVFNADAIDNVSMYRANAPAAFGGRLSSVVAVEQRTGNYNTWKAAGGVGLLASRLTVDGPLVRNRLSVLASARRTYADLFLPFADDPKLHDDVLHFYDFNGRLAFRPDSLTNAWVSGFYGQDKLITSKYAGIQWNNACLSTGVRRVLSPHSELQVQATYTRFRYQIDSDGGEGQQARSEAGVQEAGTAFTYTRNLRRTLALGAGVQVVHRWFEPSRITPTGDSSFITASTIPVQQSLETVGFAELTYTPTQRLRILASARAGTYGLTGAYTYYTFNPHSISQLPQDTLTSGGGLTQLQPIVEPRLAVYWQLRPELELRAYYNRGFQALHQLTPAGSPRPYDMWVMAGPGIPTQQADQFGLGISYKRVVGGNILLEGHAETYYKRLHNQIDLIDFADLIANERFASQIRVGRGQAYGLELLTKLGSPKLNGWVSYTLSRSERQISGINYGAWYPVAADRPHNVSIVLNYTPFPRWSLSTVFVYQSGNPATLPSGMYVVSGISVPWYEGRNQQRFMPTHRLDVSLTFRSRPSEFRRFRYEVIAGCYNVYGSLNPFGLRFKEVRENSSERPVITAQTPQANVRSSIQNRSLLTYLFTYVPSLTLNFYW